MATRSPQRPRESALRTHWRFYWPLALTGVAMVLAVQFQNGAPGALSERRHGARGVRIGLQHLRLSQRRVEPRAPAFERVRAQPSRQAALSRVHRGVEPSSDHSLRPDRRDTWRGHRLLNWRGAWDVTPWVRLFARLLNLLDVAYADRADFAFGSYRYFPGMPRQLYAGVEVKLFE